VNRPLSDELIGERKPIMPPGYSNPIERIPRWKTALNLVVIALAVALLAYSVGPTLIEMIWRNR